MSEALAHLTAALAAAHARLVQASSLPGALEQLDAQICGIGHRLEAALDAERRIEPALIARRIVEPDLVPLGDSLARALGPLLSPTTSGADDDGAVALVIDLVAIFEGSLGAAMHSFGAPAPRYPLPWRAPFDASVHRLVERARGPEGIVIAVERAGREAKGGRLESPAWVVVGGGA